MKLYTDAVIIPVDKDHRIIENGALAIEGNTIVDIGDSDIIKSRYPDGEVFDLKGGIMIPGLINTHIHLAQSLLRGMAEEMPLFPDWLQYRIWPMQGSYTGEEFLVSARLALCEMIKTGTTTFLETMLADHYGIPGLVKEVESCGLRGMLSKIVMDRNTPNDLPDCMTESLDSSLALAIDYYKEYNGAADGRVGIWFGPRWSGMFEPKLLPLIAENMHKYGIHTDIHYAEVTEDAESIRKATGLTPGQYLKETGLAGPNTVIVHATKLADTDYEILAETGTSISHCPISAMHGSLGYLDVPKALDTGVNVAMGTDALACDNNADLFLDMRVGALLQTFVKSDSRALPAYKVLEMATINGAKALGLEDKIGSLEIGKRADFAVLNTNQIKYAPRVNPVSYVVYGSVGNDVMLTVCDGKELYRNGKVLTMDEEKCMTEANILGKAKYEKLLNHTLI